MIHIRRATCNDAQNISLLARITFTETFLDYFRDKQDLFNYTEQTFNVPKIRSSLQKENNNYWIAFFNELPVGYAKKKVLSTTQFIPIENVSQLQKIYVIKEFLDKKVGKSLMEVLMDSFMESCHSHIWLSVLKSNERAVKFYRRHGFEQIGDHFFKIGKEVFDFSILCYEKTPPVITPPLK